MEGNVKRYWTTDQVNERVNQKTGDLQARIKLLTDLLKQAANHVIYDNNKELFGQIEEALKTD